MTGFDCINSFSRLATSPIRTVIQALTSKTFYALLIQIRVSTHFYWHWKWTRAHDPTWPCSVLPQYESREDWILINFARYLFVYWRFLLFSYVQGGLVYSLECVVVPNLYLDVVSCSLKMLVSRTTSQQAKCVFCQERSLARELNMIETKQQNK